MNASESTKESFRHGADGSPQLPAIPAASSFAGSARDDATSKPGPACLFCRYRRAGGPGREACYRTGVYKCTPISSCPEPSC
jgi:hypothetical protein